MPKGYAGWAGNATTAEVLTFHGLADGREHLLLALGPWEPSLLGQSSEAGGPVNRGPLVRLHSECMTGDVFGSERCDCGPQLREAVEGIASAGGFLLYLRQEGRGIALYSKLDAYALQDRGLDTYDGNLALGHGEDERDYSAAAQMLSALGATSVRLLSDNPDKAARLAACGIGIERQIPTGVHLSDANSRYLAAKRDRTRTYAGTRAGRRRSFRAGRPGPAGHARRLASVDALVPGLRARPEETEQLRRLPAGSNDLLADGLFVPDYRVVEWALLAGPDNPESLLHPDPLIHAPMATLLNLVAPAVAVGSAEYAPELFRDQLLAPRQKNRIKARQTDSVMAQARYARASGALAAAKLHWRAALCLLPGEGHGCGITEAQRASFRLSLALGAEASQEAVRLAAAGSGGSMHRLSHPLQRIQRDVGVLLNHPTLGIDPILEQAGRGLLGLGFTAQSF